MEITLVLNSYLIVLLYETFVHDLLSCLVGNSQIEIIISNWITCGDIHNYQCVSALMLISLMAQFVAAGTKKATVQTWNYKAINFYSYCECNS